MTPMEELYVLADRLDLEAGIAARPDQMDRLEAIAQKLRDFAAMLEVHWGLRIDHLDHIRKCTEHAAWLAAPPKTPVSRVVGPWQDTTPNPPTERSQADVRD